MLDTANNEPNASLVSDDESDQLTGGSGADWFIIDLLDKVTELVKFKGALQSQFYGDDYATVVGP